MSDEQIFEMMTLLEDIKAIEYRAFGLSGKMYDSKLMESGRLIFNLGIDIEGLRKSASSAFIAPLSNSQYTGNVNDLLY